MEGFRREKDSIGELEIQKDAYYGVQSARGAENFHITGHRMHPQMIRSIAEIKMAAAMVNAEVGVLEPRIADAIVQACRDILDGQLHDSFICDAVQGGAGTSFNMNANEVIANRAIELLGGQKGDYSIVHPNDHVNCGQSTNDVFPSSGRIAAIRLLMEAQENLLLLRDTLQQKAKEFDDVIKMGRTEMQDAVPVRLGQSFAAYAEAVDRNQQRFNRAMDEMRVLNMGGTAIGTGLNADSDYIKKIVPQIAAITGLKLVQADNLIDATQDSDAFVIVSGIVKSCAAILSKIANDLRLMSSGPRTGFGEISLPSLQNGSSIMPGKVNPVIPEVVNEIAFAVIGYDTTITLASEAGQLELNAFEPVIFYSLFQAIDMVSHGANALATKCVNGIVANRERCIQLVESSVGIITALCPHIGYTAASDLAKKAMKEGRSVRDIVLREKILTEEELDKILNPYAMTGK